MAQAEASANRTFAEVTEEFVKRHFVQSTLRELTWALAMPRLWMAFAIVVGLFAITGPFGTYEALDFPARLGYWFITQAITWGIALCSIAAVGAALDTSGYKEFRTVLIGAALASIPITIAVQLIGHVIFARPVTLEQTAWQFLTTVPISLLLCTLVYLVMRPDPEASAEESPSGHVPGQRLLNRLSPENRGEVLYLSMQDHYVQVVTAKGSELVLLRFSDALDELDGSNGLQIHRSHWVSRGAIAGWRRDKGKLLLEMPDGTELPVSRSYAKAVRSAGFIDDADTA